MQNEWSGITHLTEIQILEFADECESMKLLVA